MALDNLGTFVRLLSTRHVCPARGVSQRDPSDAWDARRGLGSARAAVFRAARSRVGDPLPGRGLYQLAQMTTGQEPPSRQAHNDLSGVWIPKCWRSPPTIGSLSMPGGSARHQPWGLGGVTGRVAVLAAIALSADRCRDCSFDASATVRRLARSAQPDKYRR
jgi:hypothetical protein